jgi:protein-S-isoprenylcysteine O-methyltransferase Ste14
MFPVLVWMYPHLAKTEQEQMRAEFGDPYDSYASAVPAFIPHLGYRSTELPR